MGFYLPKTLERLNQWGLWKREGAQKKPYSAKYNGAASVSKPYQWTDYATAIFKLESAGEEYEGLGFLFTSNCGLVFIDIDHCMDEDGEPNEFAREIIGLFKGSYMEYSQSGTGLHIVCRGTIPAAYKGAKIELYSANRYMAFTGNAYEASEPQPAQDALDELCKRFNIAEQTCVNVQETCMSEADEKIIERAKRGANGKQFEELYAGEWEGKYKTQSSADMRLIALLWYYSGNAEQVERIFLASGLGQREKAKRADYVRRTIETAARNTVRTVQRHETVTDRRGNYSVSKPQEERKYRGRSYNGK